MPTMYYDKAGHPITVEEFDLLLDDDSYRRIGQTQLEEVLVSTVWLGIDYSFGLGVPRLFETMCFGTGAWANFIRRYPTAATAAAGHDDIVAKIERGEAPPQCAD